MFRFGEKWADCMAISRSGMNQMDAECLVRSILFAGSLVIGNAQGFGW